MIHERGELKIIFKTIQKSANINRIISSGTKKELNLYKALFSLQNYKFFSKTCCLKQKMYKFAKKMYKYAL